MPRNGFAFCVQAANKSTKNNMEIALTIIKTFKYIAIVSKNPIKYRWPLAAIISLTLTGCYFLHPWLAYLIAVNLVAFACMGYDKQQARLGQLRVPEKFYFMLVFFGGAPGTIIGMHTFHHKTRKASFQLHVVVIFFAQLLILKLINLF